jgi:hypothetical protein
MRCLGPIWIVVTNKYLSELPVPLHTSTRFSSGTTDCGFQSPDSMYYGCWLATATSRSRKFLMPLLADNSTIPNIGHGCKVPEILQTQHSTNSARAFVISSNEIHLLRQHVFQFTRFYSNYLTRMLRISRRCPILPRSRFLIASIFRC